MRSARQRTSGERACRSGWRKHGRSRQGRGAAGRDGNREAGKRPMNSFSELPDIAVRIARLERELSDEQRKRYLAFKDKQAAAREKAQKLLDRRFHDYHAEQRKHPLTAVPERLVRDSTAPRAFRDAARLLIAQRELVAKLPAAQELERRDFLLALSLEESPKQAISQNTETTPPDNVQSAADERHARMQERLAQARQKPSEPQRGGPGWE